MNLYDNTAAILDFVFPSSVTQTEISPEIKRCTKFFVIPGQNGPRWIVPSCAPLGKSVLAQWQPYNFISKLKWKGLLLIYTLGCLGKIPGVNSVNIRHWDSQQITAMDTSCVPVLYVGTPGPQQKVVVTFVSKDSGRPQAIMKVALGHRANAGLLREATILDELTGNDVLGAPSLLAVEEKGKRSWQTVVTGRLTSRKLTSAHIDLLLHFPKTDKTTTLLEQQKLLQHEIGNNSFFSKKDRRTATLFASMICGGQIPLVLVHGDFTPWNLKKLSSGIIAAIDWECANIAGLPLWDLCHFFFMQAHLFKDAQPVKKLAANSLVQRYLTEMRLDKQEFIALVLSYILWVACDREAVYSEAYKEFLLTQLPLAGAN